MKTDERTEFERAFGALHFGAASIDGGADFILKLAGRFHPLSQELAIVYRSRLGELAEFAAARIPAERKAAAAWRAITADDDGPNFLAGLVECLAIARARRVGEPVPKYAAKRRSCDTGRPEMKVCRMLW